MNCSGNDTAYLVLEDGLVFEGFRFGSKNNVKGEVVFTTSMNGYVESLSDPSYKGQILAITHPLVGNYGVPEKIRRNGILSNFESENIQVSGLIVGEITNGSEWNSEKSLEKWLEEESVPGISGIDTRSLAIHIRDKGAMAGVISNEKEFGSKKDYESINFVDMVSIKRPMVYENKGPTVVVMDYGLKEGILDCIYSMGYSIARLPYNSTEKQVLSYNPYGIVLTNGPGNPMLLGEEAKTVAKLIEHKIPMLGICLGHQLVAMASGMKIRKMGFGHRAINKGVIELGTGRCMITTHNHGYEVFGDVPDGIEVSYVSLDDKTIEGMIMKSHNVMTVQFHPEARPGTKDGLRIFELFDSSIKGFIDGK
ncbi:MAG: glutamine-hydrolyzing carbamoyl-phosphate synthase small subunit [Methanothrix sp.]